MLNWGQHHAATKAYVARQTERGRTPREIRRMLKRVVAREVYRLLVCDCPAAVFDDLRPARQAKNITLRDAARQLGTWPSVLSNLERGLRRDHDLTNHYRDRLQAALPSSRTPAIHSRRGFTNDRSNNMSELEPGW